MKKLTYIGQVREGKLWLSDEKRAQMITDVGRMKEGRNVELEIHLLPHRSNPQNNYYWGVVVDMVCTEFKERGFDVNAVLTHEILKLKFNTKYIYNDEGEVISEYGGTTTQLTTTEFMIYLEAIQRWASSTLGLYIPDPNEQITLKFEDED